MLTLTHEMLNALSYGFMLCTFFHCMGFHFVTKECQKKCWPKYIFTIRNMYHFIRFAYIVPAT